MVRIRDRAKAFFLENIFIFKEKLTRDSNKTLGNTISHLDFSMTEFPCFVGAITINKQVNKTSHTDDERSIQYYFANILDLIFT